MSHVLKSGFQIFVDFRSFAVVQRNLEVGAFSFMQPRKMGSRRLYSNSSKATESVGVELQQESDKGVVKEVVAEGTVVGSEVFEDDLDKIDSMTVQQLRLKLRDAGVPAKGRKNDLVLALKSFLNGKVNGEGLLKTQAPSRRKPIVRENNSTRRDKRSSNGDCDQNVNNVSEFSAVKKFKLAEKRVSTEEDSVVKTGTVVLAAKQQQSVKINELTGNKPTKAKGKVLSQFDTIDLSVDQTEPWTILSHKKPQQGWIPYNPKTMRPPPLTGNSKHMKLMSWNVNGLRALMKLEGFSVLQLAQREDFDVLCLQETKLQEKDVKAVGESLLEGYENSFWTCSVAKLGYSGTAIISRIKPLSIRYGLGISDYDSEGRLVTLEFDNFYLLSAYVPNSGDGLRRLSYRVTQWDPSLSNYMKELERSKPVILTGDLNCAHSEIDIYNPAGNRRSAGFTDEERQSFETNFLNRGFVDTFRKQHPGVVGYTYWGYRHGTRKTNKGWRLDYYLVSESIAEDVHDSYILPDVMGSDHCPVGLILKL